MGRIRPVSRNETIVCAGVVVADDSGVVVVPQEIAAEVARRARLIQDMDRPDRTLGPSSVLEQEPQHRLWLTHPIQPRCIVSKSTSLALPQRALGRLSHVLLQAILVAAGGLAIVVSARVAVPLPFSPVPITGQTLAVLLVAGLLGRRSALSVALYLCGGALGLPVFAADWGGFARLTGPTGGYLWGFILAAYVVGWLAERSRGDWRRLLVALLTGQALIYGCGLFWLRRFVPAGGLLVAGLYPFLVGDGLKLVAALVLVAAGRRAALRLG